MSPTLDDRPEASPVAAGHRHQESNDARMWAEYHLKGVGTVTHFLNWLKTAFVCELFASRILRMAGPVSSVLELGCGTASTLNVIRRRTGAACTGVDRCIEGLELARVRHPELDLREADIFDLPFPPKSFDLVYSVGLLEHFDHRDQERLLQIHGDLARKGAVLMVPADSLVMNSILHVNRRWLGRSGTWADEQVFSPRSLRAYFPTYAFEAAKDHRFLNMILWFGWKTGS